MGQDPSKFWQSKKGKDNDPLNIINKRNWQQKFCDAEGNGQLANMIPNDSDIEGLKDIDKLNRFLEKKWFPLIQWINNLGASYKNNFAALHSPIQVITPYNNRSYSYTPKDIAEWILNINGISSDLFKNYDLTNEECITTFKSKINRINYYIYFIYNSNDNLIIAAAEGPGSRSKKNSKSTNIIYSKIAQIANESDDICLQNIKDAYKDVEATIIAKIKNVTNTDNLDDLSAIKNTEFVRVIDQDALSIFSRGLECNLVANDFEQLNDSIWKQVDSENPERDIQDIDTTISVDIPIKMTYSYIDELNKLIKLCIDNKVKYSLKRVSTSSRLLKLIKTSIKNNDIENVLKQLFTTPIQLVATYYYKKLNTINSNTNAISFDENQCAGIIVTFNNKYLAIPTSSYSGLTATQQEHSRLKNNTNILKTTWNVLKNPVNTLFHNNTSLKDIVNLGRDNEKALLDYILKDFPNIKEFNDFYQANQYLKNFTSAQHIKIESAFSHLENQNTKANETILLLTITLASKDKVAGAVDKFIQEHQDNIIDYQNTLAKINEFKNKIKI